MACSLYKLWTLAVVFLSFTARAKLEEVSPKPVLCGNVTCYNGGACEALQDGSLQCKCLPGWKSPDCSQRVDPCDPNPCENRGLCREEEKGFVCECDENFTGSRCERRMTCEMTECGENEVCLDDGSFVYCSCKPDYHRESEDDACRLVKWKECLSSPCLNGGTCKNSADGYKCICTRDFEGANCEVAYAASCLSEDNINLCQNGGLCRNTTDGAQQCYCPAFFGGRFCEIDQSKCVTDEPCKNNATCVGHQSPPYFICTCVPGYEGKRCEVNINECLLNPCKNGGVCTDLIDDVLCECAEGWKGKYCTKDVNECKVDGLVDCSGRGECVNTRGSFFCFCEAGYDGKNCEFEIDECKSSPCLNGAKCIDRLADFECDCAGTGYYGDRCQFETDECETVSACVNGATCVDLVNDYRCVCNFGYVGKNCSIDEDECSSNPCANEGKCLQRSDRSLYGGDEKIHPLLPEVFSYSNASGFVCECRPGFEGEWCEAEIDECARYQPCSLNRTITCVDMIDGYECVCDASSGGRNCSVELTGCRDDPCLNGGSCSPYLISEQPEEHGYKCQCRAGYTGGRCQKPTVFSFDHSEAASSSASFAVDTGTDAPTRVSFQFRTTLTASTLALLRFSDDEEWRLRLASDRVSLLFGDDVMETDPASSIVDGEWHRIGLSFGNGTATLQLDDEEAEGTTRVDVGRLAAVRFGAGDFVGCARDLRVDHVAYAAEEAVVEGEAVVVGGCEREPVCDVAERCRSRGSCVDLWSDYRCICQRPYFNRDCVNEIEPYTFGHLNTTNSHAVFDISKAVHDAEDLEVSFFIIFSQTTADILTLDLRDISLRVDLSNSSIQLSDGYELFTNDTKIETGDVLHQFVLTFTNASFVSVQIDNETVISNAVVTRSEHDGRRRRRRRRNSEDDVTVTYEKLTVGGRGEESGGHLKGLVQDLQVNEFRLVFDQSDQLLPDDGKAQIPASSVRNVLRGRVSDPMCSSGDGEEEEKCLHGGECLLGFNSFTCACEFGWSGERCERADFCSLMTSCPVGMTCVQLSPVEYECQGAYTRSGERRHTRRYRIADSSLIPRGSFQLDVEFRTRSTDATLIEFENRDTDSKLSLKLSKRASLQIEFSASSNVHTYNDTAQQVSDGEWHKLQITSVNQGLKIVLDHVPFTLLTTSQTPRDRELFSPGSELFVSLGSFKGCIDNLRVNEHLLPLYSTRNLSLPAGYSPRIVMTTDSDDFPMATRGGCTSDDVCLGSIDGPCLNGANCTDRFNLFRCDCLPGFEGDRCEINIDDCVGHNCSFTGKCVDGIRSYTCQCQPGYRGPRCELDIDECANETTCINGGKCRNYEGGYQCICPKNFVGANCGYSRQQRCGDGNQPCKNGARCINSSDGEGFVCECVSPYLGELCDKLVDHCGSEPCQNNGLCLEDKIGYTCKCGFGYEGARCEVITECSSTTCFNGGTCINRSNSSTERPFQCICPPGRAGRRCETVDRCYRDTATTTGYEEFCANGGTCRVTYPLNDSLPTFGCACPFEFVGARCTYPNPCSNSTCRNSGACVITWSPDDKEKRSIESSVDQPQGTSPPPNFKCLCPDGFSGPTCEKDAKTRISSLIRIAGIVSGSFFLLLVVVIVVLVRTCLGRRAQSAEYRPSRAEEMANGVKLPPLPPPGAKTGYVSTQMLHELKPPPPCERLI